MADPFIGEIRALGFNFAPQDWALCDGRLLPISQHTALFSLLGTTYGGDGRTTFALPDLQGRIPMHPGQGPGLSDYDLGEVSGDEQVTLISSEMPVHSHALQMSAAGAEETSPQGAALAAGLTIYGPASSGLVPMKEDALPPAGGGQPHNNMMPYQTVLYCIALRGIFPPRG